MAREGFQKRAPSRRSYRSVEFLDAFDRRLTFGGGFMLVKTKIHTVKRSGSVFSQSDSSKINTTLSTVN